LTSGKRSSWVAAVLSIALPGLGQLYAGRPLRGLICFIGYLVSIALALTVVLGLAAAPWNVAIGVLIAAVGFAAIAVDAVRLVEKAAGPSTRAWWDRSWVYLAAIVTGTLIGGTAAVGIVRAHVVAAYRLPSAAMSPTLLPGDAFLVWRPGEVRVGDVVALTREHGAVVRRVIAVGGQVVESINDKVAVDGQILDLAAAAPGQRARGALRRNFARRPVTLAPGTAFVLADNRDRTLDSREWGAIPRAAIKGRVAVIYWSLDPTTGRVRWDRIGKRLD